MEFMGVWGFDPEEIERDQYSSQHEAHSVEPSYTTSDEREARLPTDSASQVYELRRMFRR